MKTKITSLFVVRVCTLGLFTGCEPEYETTPILAGETAVLVVTFTPSPVYQGYGDKYRFTVFVDEINGVGARISSIKIESVGEDGIVIETDTYDEYDVVRTFGTSRIEAFGRLMTNVELTECLGCNRVSWLVRAEDDRGHHVEYSQSVELIDR
jgi:hypothetical protein